MIKRLILDIIELSLISVLLFGIVYLFVGQLLEVSGNSMDPYIRDREQLITEKLSLTFNPIKKGDVIVITHPEDKERFLVKRVVATPGDTIGIKNNNIYINQSEIEEDYLTNNPLTNPGPYLNELEDKFVQNNTYFVMGDNREHSTDSRHWGLVHDEQIVGKVLMVYYPFENIRLLLEQR